VRKGFWLEDLIAKDPLEVLSVDGGIILKWIFKKSDGVMDWIDLAPDRDRWRALVNAVMNFSTSVNCGKFLDCLRTC
jgi:hypothetical protein